MNWIIKSGVYNIWQNFDIEVKQDIIFETGCFYQMEGVNGSGKTSFLKKVLLPQLQRRPDDQYIIYVEQQVQSQLDAIKSYALLQKPAVRICSIEDMFDYQLNHLSIFLQQSPRPVIMIIDETTFYDKLNLWLDNYSAYEIFVVFATHQVHELENRYPQKIISVCPINQQLSNITL